MAATVAGLQGVAAGYQSRPRARRTTEAVNRPSVTAERSWPAAPIRAAPRLPWKKLRIVGASDPGRGYGTSLLASEPATPPMNVAADTTPLRAARSGVSCVVM